MNHAGYTAFFALQPSRKEPSPGWRVVGIHASFMDLATGEKAVFDPEEQAGVEEGEQFWCWAAPVSHDPEKKELVIAGCYWAAPYEKITFDFSSPMNPPYTVLKVEDDEDD